MRKRMRFGGLKAFSPHLQEEFREAIQMMASQCIDRLERELPKNAYSGPSDADVAIIATESGLLYISTRDSNDYYEGATPVFSTLTLLEEELPTILDACGLYRPARVEVFRFPYA